MTLVIHLAIGIMIGFLGFLPIGMTNMSVADSAARKGFYPALRIGLGASFVGILQALISLQSSSVLMSYSNFENTLTWISVPILIGVGIFYLMRDSSLRFGVTVPLKTPRLSGIAKGMFISTMNVIAIPYWMFYGTYLSGNAAIHVDDITAVIFMSVGGGIGMMLAFFLYAYIAVYARERTSIMEKYSSRAVSMVMFGLGAVQIFRVLT